MKSNPSLLSLVHRTSQIMADRFAKAHSGDVRPRQITILRAVNAMPGTSQTALVEATGVDRSTASEIVTRLVKRGLLKRRRSKSDARAYVLDLTPDGRRVLDEAEPVLARVEADMLAAPAIPERQREVFVSALERIVKVISPATNV